MNIIYTFLFLIKLQKRTRIFLFLIWDNLDYLKHLLCYLVIVAYLELS